MALRSLRWIVDRLIRRTAAERDLDDEIKAHLAIAAEQRIADGESPETAWSAARRELGNELLVKDATRQIWGFTSFERLWQDARYGLRTFRRSASVTVVACAALALGTGATTAIFTIVHAVLIRPLPYPDPHRLVMIWERQPTTGRNNVVSLANFRSWQERSRSFTGMAAYQRIPMNLLGSEEAVQVDGAAVTADFFRLLGVEPTAGRTFLPGEDQPASPPVAVLSHGFWLRHFAGAADAVGRRVSINGRHHEIVGVMPQGFAFPHRRVQAFVVLRGGQEDGRNHAVVARLRPGVGLTAAQDEMAAIAAQTAEERPLLNAKWSATVVGLHGDMVRQVRRGLLVLFAAVAFVLLIACANIANLLLMRAAARTREFTLRLALGAGRLRLLHQVMVESLILAAVGSALGVALAWLGLRAFVRLLPPAIDLPRLHEISIDPFVLLFAVGVAGGTALLFGLGPALVSGRSDDEQLAARAGRSVTTAQRRLQGTMVIAEVALAVPLLAGAGLMVHSLQRLTHVDPGFRAEGVLTVRMLLLPARDRALHAELVDDVLARVRALPEVRAAGSIGRLPMDGGNSGSWYYRADRPAPPLGQRPGGDISIVTPGYFAAMGIPAIRGRDFTGADRMGTAHVGILNQTAARAFFGDEDPVGKRLTVSWNDTREVEIVGVMGDIRHGQINRKPDPCLFLPNSQQPFPFTALVVRTNGDPLRLVGPVKQQIRSADPDQGVGEIHTMEQLVAGAIAQPRAQTMLFGLFGALALALTCIGIYGVLAYAVTQRTREIGVRLALGAPPASAFALVLRDGLRLTLIGLAIGLGLAIALTGFMQGLLYEVEPLDPLVLATVTILLAAVAAAACAIPAARAMRIDPAVVLRTE
jgi:predicted permease